MKCISKKSGFTLAELMVVVSILGILVTISIAVFGNHSGESEKAVCDANKTALMQHMDMEEVNGLELIPTVASADELGTMLVKTEASMESCACPSGGEYSIAYRDSHDPNSWYIHCDVHDGEASGVLPVFGDDGGKVKEFIEKLNDAKLTNNIDSEASLNGQSSDNVKKVLELSEKLGIYPKSGLLTSWQYTAGKEILFSNVDISKIYDGDYVPVLRYNNNKDSNYNGTFTVWICEIKNKKATEGVKFNGTTEYNVIYNIFSSSKVELTTKETTGLTAEDKMNYDNMKKLYDKVMNLYNSDPKEFQTYTAQQIRDKSGISSK